VKKTLGISLFLVLAPIAQGADIDAGKAKVAAVCAACHGPTGVSVSDSIPNLAAQRAAYLEAQLKALKEGTRKNPIMNAIAAQLSADEMANVAAYFAAQPGPETGAKSIFLPNVAATHLTFPEGYKDTFVKYHAINFPATSQVRYYFANKGRGASSEGWQGARRLGAFRRGHAAKLDAEKKPIVGSDGLRPTSSSCTRRWLRRGLGQGFPDMPQRGLELRRFHDRQAAAHGINQAECLACHKPPDNVSYTFTLQQLAAAK
jgi:cytochrome c553